MGKCDEDAVRPRRRQSRGSQDVFRLVRFGAYQVLCQAQRRRRQRTPSGERRLRSRPETRCLREMEGQQLRLDLL